MLEDLIKLWRKTFRVWRFVMFREILDQHVISLTRLEEYHHMVTYICTHHSYNIIFSVKLFESNITLYHSFLLFIVEKFLFSYAFNWPLIENI